MDEYYREYVINVELKCKMNDEFITIIPKIH